MDFSNSDIVYIKATNLDFYHALKIDRIMNEKCFPFCGLSTPEEDKITYEKYWKDGAFIQPFCGICEGWCFASWSPDVPTSSLKRIEENYKQITEEEFNEKYKDKIFKSNKEGSTDIFYVEK